MKKLFFLALFFFLTSVQASILPPNCNAFQGEQFEDCQNILTDSSLSIPQKEDLYLNLLNGQSELASYDFAYNWNKNLPFATPPTQTHSDGIIKNAWVKIVDFEKAFLDQDANQWFLPPTGTVLFRGNYSIQVPSGTAPGDCQTNYSYSVLEDQKKIVLNGNELGNQPEAIYELPNQDGLNANFAAELRVHTRLQIDHYQMQQHSFFDGWQWHYWWQCDYHHTEYQENQVQAQDTRQAQTIVTQPALTAKFEPKNDYYLAFFQLDSNQPINRLKIEIGNGSFEFSKTAFDLNAEPSGIVAVTRVNKDTNSINGLNLQKFDQNKDQFSLGVPQITPCTATITTDFEENTADCGLTELKPSFLGLELDKNRFDQNEQIQATIKLTDENQNPLMGKPVFLKTVAGKTELQTNEDGVARTMVLVSDTKGTVSAEFTDDQEFSSNSITNRFLVVDRETHQVGISVALFFGAYYLIFLLAKKKFGVGF